MFEHFCDFQDAEYIHRRVFLTMEGEYCVRCQSKTPLSLKILSCNEILIHKEITMVGVSLLPGQLIKFLMEVGLNIPKKDDWDVIKSSMSVLLEYWPYKELGMILLCSKGKEIIIIRTALEFMESLLYTHFSLGCRHENIIRV